MASKFVEGYIRFHESVLNEIRALITDKGETTDEVQEVIDQALDELGVWYEMREQFE